MRSSVTPESMRSDSESCSWVVVQGWMASVLESPTLERRISSGKVGRLGKGIVDELGEVGNEFETIYDLAASSCAAFDTE